MANAWSSSGWEPKAQADVGKLLDITSVASSDLTAAGRTLDDYVASLTRIRNAVDTPNAEYNTAKLALNSDDSRLAGLEPLQPGPPART